MAAAIITGDKEGVLKLSTQAAAPAPESVEDIGEVAPPVAVKKKVPLPLVEVEEILAWEREPYRDDPEEIEAFRSSNNAEDDDEVLQLLPEELKARVRKSIRRRNAMVKAEADSFSEYQVRIRAAMDSSGVVMVDGDFFAARAKAQEELDEYWGKILDGGDSVYDLSGDEEEDDDLDSFRWLR